MKRFSVGTTISLFSITLMSFGLATSCSPKSAGKRPAGPMASAYRQTISPDTDKTNIEADQPRVLKYRTYLQTPRVESATKPSAQSTTGSQSVLTVTPLEIEVDHQQKSVLFRGSFTVDERDMGEFTLRGDLDELGNATLEGRNTDPIADAMCFDGPDCRKLVLTVYYKHNGKYLRVQFLGAPTKGNQAYSDRPQPPPQQPRQGSTRPPTSKKPDTSAPGRPTAQPTRPTTQPTRPSAQPAQPAQPSTQPNKPSTQPTQPSPQQPSKPSTQPPRSSQPTQPSQPNRPQPVTPSEPTDSSTKPEVPAGNEPPVQEKEDEDTMPEYGELVGNAINEEIAREFGLSIGNGAPPQAFGSHFRIPPAGGIPGRLEKATLLPEEGPGFERKTRGETGEVWGTKLIVDFIELAGKRFAEKFPDRPRLVVTAISPKGGVNDTHASHQSGLDADLRYPRTDNKNDGLIVTRASHLALLDVERLWELSKTAAESGYLISILVHEKAKNAICRFVKEKGEYVAQALSGTKEQLILHRAISSFTKANDHHNHFHIRLACPPANPGCQTIIKPSKKPQGLCD